MAYADNIAEKEKNNNSIQEWIICFTRRGWFKQRRTFHVVKGMLLFIIFYIQFYQNFNVNEKLLHVILS